MLPEDRRWHEGTISNIEQDKALKEAKKERLFPSDESVAKILEGAREDLTQLLAFERITNKEYDEFDAKYAELQKDLPQIDGLELTHA